jgi:hypothetical protein
MAEPKIDPRLAAELERLGRAGERERTVPVIIEHAVGVVPGCDEDPVGELDRMREAVRRSQQGIVARLSELGAGEGVEQATLANSLAARLTYAQIADIAGRSDVKLIRLDRADYVTTDA